MAHRILWLLLIVFICVTGLTAPVSAAPDVDRATPLAVTGYILGGAGDGLVERNAHALTTLTVVGVSLTADGRHVTAPDRGTTRLRAVAHDNGLRAELLLSNYSNALGDFDSRAAGRLLRSDANVRRVAGALANFVADGGWDGVNVDLEALRPGDGDGLVLLVGRLQELMPKDKSVSIDVSARTRVSDYRRAGYHLKELAETVDVIQLMAYDMHGPTWSGPGPIGPLDWQRRALTAALKKVPAAQIDLGVAGYGYTWPQRGTGRSLSPRAARKLVDRDSARAVWDDGAGEWTATLDNGTVLWWSDARSFKQRLQLARGYSLHGLALWRLGSADPL